MGYVIQLAAYEGPFDLLLDLISKNKVDIWDIPIAAITEQYLAYLHSLKELDLTLTGEFLVMAATLIRIKSRLLLPEKTPQEPEEEPDPRDELVGQLLRYKFFKEAAAFLQEEYEENVSFYDLGHFPARLNDAPVFTNPVGDLDLVTLSRLYGQLLKAAREEPAIHTVNQRISVQERLAMVRLQLVGQPRVSFFSLLKDRTPQEIVVTFLAVLELVRLGEVYVLQNEMFGEIAIKPQGANLEVQP